MQVTPPTTSGAASPMARIEARLERIERMLSRYDELAQQVPPMAAMAGDIADEWAARDGHADERLRSLVELTERLTRPEVLHALTVLVEQVELAPGLLAMLGDIVDEMARDAEAQGVDLQELTANLGEALRGVVLLAGRPEVRELFESELFSEGAIRSLSMVARSLAESSPAEGEEPARVGLWGAMGALRDPDVQRALGFAVRVAKGVGESMDREGNE